MQSDSLDHFRRTEEWFPQLEWIRFTLPCFPTSFIPVLPPESPIPSLLQSRFLVKSTFLSCLVFPVSHDPCTAPSSYCCWTKWCLKTSSVTGGDGKFRKAGGAAGIFGTCARLPAGAERPRAMKLLPLHLEDFLGCRRGNSFLRKHLLPYNIGIEKQKRETPHLELYHFKRCHSQLLQYNKEGLVGVVGTTSPAAGAGGGIAFLASCGLLHRCPFVPLSH